MDRTAQELIINQLVDKISEFDEDLILKLQDSISESLSDNNREEKFIELYEMTRVKLDALISDQYNCPYDIWEFFWNKLFGTNGIIDRAYKLVPFDTDIIDSSYEDEVFWIMSNWKDTVKAIKEKQERETYWNNI